MATNTHHRPAFPAPTDGESPASSPVTPIRMEPARVSVRELQRRWPAAGGPSSTPQVVDESQRRWWQRWQRIQPSYQFGGSGFVGRSVRVTVSSLKGGAGKSTTTAGLGQVWSQDPRQSVIGVDADEGPGTLALRALGGPVPGRGARAFLGQSSTQIRQFTARSTRSRFEVLSGAPDLTPGEVGRMLDAAARAHAVVVTDTGSRAGEVLREVAVRTDMLVVPCTSSADQIVIAHDTLRWWQAQAPHLIPRAVLAITQPAFTVPEPLPSWRALRRLRAEFDRQLREQREDLLHQFGGIGALVWIPHDPQLAGGGQLVFDQLDAGTRRAFYALAEWIHSHS